MGLFAAAPPDPDVGVADLRGTAGLLDVVSKPLDLGETVTWLHAAAALGDADATLDAVLDVVALTMGIPAITQQVREVLGHSA